MVAEERRLAEEIQVITIDDEVEEADTAPSQQQTEPMSTPPPVIWDVPRPSTSNPHPSSNQPNTREKNKRRPHSPIKFPLGMDKNIRGDIPLSAIRPQDHHSRRQEPNDLRLRLKKQLRTRREMEDRRSARLPVRNRLGSRLVLPWQEGQAPENYGDQISTTIRSPVRNWNPWEAGRSPRGRLETGFNTKRSRPPY